LSVLGARRCVGHDIDPAKVERLVAKGATKADSAEPVAACQDLFKAMGKNVFHVGALGQGAGYAFENRVPRMPTRDFAPGGTIDISFTDQELETAFASGSACRCSSST
jgi:3-hydroxyisobutyrate dehydrogenase-like beta-hydroxyacid dehydrogenase